MKYIDADLLRKEIDKWKEAMADAIGEYSDGVRFALEHFAFVLDSLQQEQQEVDLDSEIEDYWVTTEWSKVITLGKFKVIARYFYGLGQLNSK